jgi:hypothetical protein
VHSPAMIIVTNHIFELHAEAAANRLAKGAESKSSSRIAAALNSVRSLLSPADAPAALPKLTDYPYRS